MGRLDGKVAFVTAAGGAIAGATARLFGAEGAAIACVDIVKDNVEKTAADIINAGGQAIAITCDVSDDDAVKSAVDRTADEYSEINVLFNAAAYSEKRHRLAEMPLDMWKAVIDVNLTGMFIVARHVIPQMQAAGGGSIINISSIYGVVGAKERPAYCAAKGGVKMLSKSIAVDYAEDNIRANSIMPGPIETPRLLARNSSIEAVKERHGARLHMNRLGRPAEIAQTALFLASNESSFTSGADMVVDAAYTAF